jgi:hypothetical protein
MRGLHTITWKRGCNVYNIIAWNLQKDTNKSIMLARLWPKFKPGIWQIKMWHITSAILWWYSVVWHTDAFTDGEALDEYYKFLTLPAVKKWVQAPICLQKKYSTVLTLLNQGNLIHVTILLIPLPSFPFCMSQCTSLLLSHNLSFSVSFQLFLLFLMHSNTWLNCHLLSVPWVSFSHLVLAILFNQITIVIPLLMPLTIFFYTNIFYKNFTPDSIPSSLYLNTSKSFHIYYLDFDFVSLSKLHFSALHVETDLKIYL